MPQIKVYLNPTALNMITDEKFGDLGLRLTESVETAFGICGKGDVAFDIISVLYTRNESPVQIEVLYTAGTDEYKKGKLFDPSETKKKKVAHKIRSTFEDFLLEHKIATLVPSVWIRPQYKSLFQEGVPDP